ncbi:hypothetical protein AN963_09170 [Brevibacillus choshinensis]|uniref:Lysine transporter LysE n=1 Tax=Brevibacillus choshinensis TaxID=54911 RepID=A0ABR5NE76_BRECH|nr:LysE family translocator [Brevibacillus choshinensis]KQL49851.1 hypothetical protein AN963_09170 [Brevibacillus choshinensis]
MELFIKYFVFGITLAISIGPVNIELIKRGLTRGFLPSWLVGIGGMTADFMILSIIYAGFGSYFTSPLVQLIFGCLGSMMLTYMGVQNTRKGMLVKNVSLEWRKSANEKKKRSFPTGFLLAIVNPLNLIFWAGIYSSLLTVTMENGIAPLSLLASIFIGIAVSNLMFALLSSMAKSYVKPSSLQIVSMVSGIVLIGYGVWMGYTTVSIQFHSA